ncbi:putative salicylate hydroxylase [Microdochium trichocladiopsis]|uniref:Salicylate hydroxylase n=1 Tax=Microdochium trichocladiopsis TaxID=1682393 RepID=A0A9P8YDM9_9PEZI|nr:putative salicylate hydroxylase [Microdochium trichocladiopsis]KAH7037413.1 putative salicylate hydroxylase [Microdochium trichocladiopsis]
MPSSDGFRPLDVAIVGGGIGGLAAATALRQAGHKVTIYERADFAGEVGASISCAANGTKWLKRWNVDIEMGDPVLLRQLISRDWNTGEPTNVVDLSQYEQLYGYQYLMFHRQYMHRMFQDSACSDKYTTGGPPAQLVVNHKCTAIDLDTGVITFENGATATHDVVIGADGIGSAVRGIIGINPDKRPADSSCLHANVTTAEAVKLGLPDFSKDNALQYWGGHNNKNKIVLSPCNSGSLLSYYCFFPRDKGDYAGQNWNTAATKEELLSPYPDLDRKVFNHLAIGEDIKPWRLWVHEPYPHWQKGVAAVLGDAAHPMMPDQSQGACQAIEDAAALGIVFSGAHFRGDVREALEVYEEVRKPRATRVQAAAARARENISERIGFSDNTNNGRYNVKDEKNKLTTEEICLYDMDQHVADVFAARRR